jgi:protease I
MPEIVMVIAPETFRDEEYAEPKAVLEERGARVTTASVTPGQCIGKLGMKAEAQVSVKDALDQTWDAAVFIGGAGARAFFDDEDAQKLARVTHERGGVVAAICIAPSILARAGLLGGRKATAFSSEKDELLAHGVMWTDDRVAVDDRIVTASGPEAATAFGRAIAELVGMWGEEGKVFGAMPHLR